MTSGAVATSTKNLEATLLFGRQRFAIAVDEAIVW
jgi:hypothetical protein